VKNNYKLRLAAALLPALKKIVSSNAIVTGDEDKWITLPKSGEHVLLGEGGEVKAGMGGKFTGKTISQVKGSKSKQPLATAKTAATTAAKEQPKPAATAKLLTGNKAHQAAKAGNLSQAETSALKNYTGSMYVDLNSRLRNDKPPAKADKKDFEQMQKAFASAATSDPINVFRGVNGAQFANLKPGESFTDKAYTSTSTNKDTANVFSGYGDSQAILNIEVPKGSRAISAESFSAFKGSNGKGEGEIILDRNGKYEVTRVDPPAKGKPRVIHVKYVQS
jgi:hypothetical protein